MSIGRNRLRLGGSILLLLSIADVAAAQEPAPQPPQAAPADKPQIEIPEVTVRQRPTPPRRTTTAAPAATRSPAPPPPPATTLPAAPTTASVFNPPFAPLSTITSTQIQTSTSENFGNLLFTTPGATSAGLAPGAARPILRGLADFRVRLQENGVVTGDVSDLGQ